MSVSIESLTVDQLMALKQRIDEEMTQHVNQMQHLKTALGKYEDALFAVTAMEEKHADRPMLVPLTSALYVPGKMGDVKSLLCDIGTGFYVERSPQETDAFLQRKIQLVRNNLGMLQKIILAKEKQGQSVEQVARQKTMAGQ